MSILSSISTALKHALYKVVSPKVFNHELKRKTLQKMQSQLTEITTLSPRPKNRKAIHHAYRNRIHLECDETRSLIVGAYEYNKRSKLNNYKDADELERIVQVILKEIEETKL